MGMMPSDLWCIGYGPQASRTCRKPARWVVTIMGKYHVYLCDNCKLRFWQKNKNQGFCEIGRLI